MNKQKRTFFIIISLLIFNCYSQEKINFEDHIVSIKNQVLISHVLGEGKNVNKRSVEYALNYLKKKGVKEKYITNRKLLQKIDLQEYKDSSFIQFYKKVSPKLEIEVNIKFKKFKISNHKISSRGKITQYIDGEIPHGAYYKGVIPKLEIDCIELVINNKNVKIPSSSYANYYDISLDNMVNGYKSIEAYSSNDGEYLFIYFYGGNAAGVYFSKLIFNKESYITEIIAGYTQLLKWGAFNNPNFIGF